MLSYLQAIVIALVQGVTELFPVSSLGHSVLVPAWIGGNWQTLVTQSSQPPSESSFYLAYIVALHVATALALLVVLPPDWLRIIAGFFRSAPAQHPRAAPQRGGLRRAPRVADRDRDDPRRPHRPRVRARLSHGLRQARCGERVPLHQRPDPPGRRAAAFAQRRRVGGRGVPTRVASDDAHLRSCPSIDALRIGSLQILALFAGISRSGITMVGGLWRGLSHEDSARFAFLLATPVILAAGVLKMPTLFGSAGDGIRGQVAVGFVVTGVTAYIAVRWLVRYFETRTLTPFAIYSLVVGAASLIRFAAF